MDLKQIAKSKKVQQLRLEKRLAKYGFHCDASDLLEPMKKSVKGTKEK